MKVDIVNYPNYEIYDDGRVYSKKRGIFLKHIKTEQGYYAVNLTKDNSTYYNLIHRLVAQHFVSNPDNNKIVDHIDRNKNNMNYNNLRWVDILTNQQNKSFFKNNTSGHKGITLVKSKNVYQYSKMVNRKKISKRFNNKIDALCYKFIIVLKIKSNLFKDHKTIHRLTTKEIKKQKRRNKCRCGKCNIFLINNH
tara:strand:+ start:168 stop:749 length:582 start_codon:yes stop_codon:yes gene_type:complete